MATEMANLSVGEIFLILLNGFVVVLWLYSKFVD